MYALGKPLETTFAMFDQFMIYEISQRLCLGVYMQQVDDYAK